MHKDGNCTIIYSDEDLEVTPYPSLKRLVYVVGANHGGLRGNQSQWATPVLPNKLYAAMMEMFDTGNIQHGSYQPHKVT